MSLLDADPYVLNVANGTLDLRELATEDATAVVDLAHLQLRKHRPADKITRITMARFDPAASAPALEA